MKSNRLASLRRVAAALGGLIIFGLSLSGCPRSGSEAIPDELAVEVSRYAPTGTVERTQPLEIVFSKAIVDASKLGQDVPVSALFTMTPSLAGAARWSAPDTVVFVPEGNFAPSTRYRVRLNPELTGPRLRLRGLNELTFNTPMFALRSVEPFIERGAKILVRLNVELSHPVSPEAARQSIAIADADGQTLDARLVTTAPGTVMAFEVGPLEALGQDRKMKVIVDGALASIAGGEPIGKQVIRDIAIESGQPIEVHEVRIDQDGGAFAIRVRLSASVDLEQVKRTLVVHPAVEHELAEAYQGFTVRGAFQPGQRYTVTLRKGLTSQNGGVLEDNVTQTVLVPDLDPMLRFADGGTYLLRSGQRKVSIETVNVDSLDIVVIKVLENNLAHVLPYLIAGARPCMDESCEYGDEGGYDYEGDYGSPGQLRTQIPRLDSMGREVFRGTIEIKADKNEKKRSALSFDDLDADDRRGLYIVEVSDRERGWIRAEKWMLATDIGLSVKVGRSYVRAQAVSLATLEPLSNVELRFVSRTNETILKAATNALGIAQQELNERPSEPLTMLVARRGNDFAYLPLPGTELPTADFDVGGEDESEAPYEAYVYADRGIYRPGDRAHVVALIRDKALATPPIFPFQLEVRDPEWRIFTSLRGTTVQDGAAAFDVDFARDAPTGSYTVRVLSSGGRTEIGSLKLKVEDFMPDRIEVKIAPVRAAVSAGEPAEFTIDAAYLFGSKASGLNIGMQCQLAEQAGPYRGFERFVFGHADPWEAPHPFDATIDLGESELDESGHADASCSIEDGAAFSGPVRASLFATVTEPGGRAVTSAGFATIHPYPHYVGLGRRADGEYVEAGQDAELEGIVVDREGRPLANVPLDVVVHAVTFNSILRLVDGRYRYVSERSEEEVARFSVQSAATAVPIPFVPSQVGQYAVRLTSKEGAGSSTTFWAGGAGEAPWSMKHPDRLALTTDRSRYLPGQTARVMVRAPFAGSLMVTVERDRVLWQGRFEMKGNTETIEIPVLPTMSPNAYVVAQLLRSPKSPEKMAPWRAFGVVPLESESKQHHLDVRLAVPKKIRPNTSFSVRVEVPGVGSRAHVTVAAVDEGILQITRFQSPNPLDFFGRRRRLALRTYDVFSWLLPEVEIPALPISPSTGGDDEIRRKHLSPISVKRIEPVALWSGVVPVGPDGVATIPFTVPQLNGTLRVMAVAFAGGRFGAASDRITVRDPITLVPTLPRFVAPLDELRVPVEVHNGTDTARDVRVEMTVDGRMEAVGAAAQTVNVPAAERRLLEFGLRADEVVGAAGVRFVAKSGNETTTSSTTLPIRPASTTVTLGASAVVRHDQPAKLSVPGGFMPSSVKAKLVIGPTPAFQFGASLGYLLGYPHGCVEQTTARAMPLLFVDDLARGAREDLGGEVNIDAWVNAGIARLLSMQMQSGGLAYWPGGSSGYPWSTVFGAHFLVEAKRAGFVVEEQALRRLLEHLEQIAAGGLVSGYGAPPDFRAQVYALYVLSLAGAPSASTLLYAADRAEASAQGTAAEALRVPVDNEIRAMLGGALFLGQQRGRAQSFLNLDYVQTPDAPVLGFYSPVRADAVTLLVLAEVMPGHRSVPGLIDALSARAQNGRWGNTQENTFALTALVKIARRLGAGQPYWGSVTVGNEVAKKFNSTRPVSITVEGPVWVGKEIQVSVTGAGAAFVGLRVEGIKAGAVPPTRRGLDVERTFLTRMGDPLEGAAHQGDLIITRIKVRRAEGGAPISNVAVVDLLPAGLEIENPRLSDRTEAFEWIGAVSVPDHADIRDDRIVFFVNDLGGQGDRTFYYVSRAVTVGNFTVPHAFAEAMYDPETQALAGAGRFVVEKAGE